MKEDMHQKSRKKLYRVPDLTVHGNIEVITQELGSGEYTDLPFPQPTKKSDLTFSDI